MKISFPFESVDFSKNILIPAVIQDAITRQVLMLGYMNRESLAQTCETGIVTFFSRSKKRLWTKGETSGNFLHVVGIKNDCDGDTLLITVNPDGPTCHTGEDTCWQETNKKTPTDFLQDLENVIQARKKEDPNVSPSYTAKLLARGINKVAQKVGEEAVELVIEAKDDNKELFLGEAADLMYHYLVLLTAKNFTLADVVGVLEKRQK